MNDAPALATIDRQPDPKIIEVLERALSQARDGDIIGVAVVAVHVGRHVSSDYHIGEATISDLYLAIERVKLRLLDID